MANRIFLPRLPRISMRSSPSSRFSGTVSTTIIKGCGAYGCAGVEAKCDVSCSSFAHCIFKQYCSCHCQGATRTAGDESTCSWQGG